MQPQAAKFPTGVKSVADYIHAKGLKVGLYTTRANRSCAGFAGSCQHEVVDVNEWASWGVDYNDEASDEG